MFGKILIVAALAVVAFILLAGIVVMAIGGETSGRWSNLRYRIAAQAGALVIILAVIYFANAG